MTPLDSAVDRAITTARGWLAGPDATDRDVDVIAWVLHLVSGRPVDTITGALQPAAFEAAPRVGAPPVDALAGVASPGGFDGIPGVDEMLAQFEVVGDPVEDPVADLSQPPAETGGRSITADLATGQIVQLDRPHGGNSAEAPPRPV